MTSLEEVYFDFSRSRNVADNGYVIKVLAKHENKPRVHVTFEIDMDRFSDVEDFFTPFKLDWAPFKTLNIESLNLVLGTVQGWYPMSFCNMIREFTSLKRLTISFTLSVTVGPVFEGEGEPMSYLGTLLGSFPNLEYFSSDAPVLDLDTSGASSLTRLSITGASEEFTMFFELSDKITFLQLSGLEDPDSLISLKFRNLVTFSLTYFNDDADDLLMHFYQSNPKLINMHLNNCRVSEETMLQIFPKIQRLYLIDIPTYGFKSALSTAKKLKQFVYVPRRDITTHDEEVLPLEWLKNAVSQREISFELELIQFGIDEIFRRMEVKTDMKNWLELVRGNTFTEEEFDKMILPVRPLWPKPTTQFIIDLKAIAKLYAN